MGATSHNFQERELACRCGCGLNGCTAKLVDALEDLRTVIGKPVNVNSAYRCAEHNAKVGGAPNSEHVNGLAADVSVAGLTATELEQYARQIPAIKGIGRADHQNYLHVDVRDTPGEWCYDETGASCEYYPPA